MKFDKFVNRFKSNDNTLFDDPQDGEMVRLEVEVSASVAANVEALETCFYRWRDAHKRGNQAECERILEKSHEICQRDPKAMMIHTIRPPSIFGEKIKTLM